VGDTIARVPVEKYVERYRQSRTKRTRAATANAKAKRKKR
jgi:hypothetical protein